MNRALHEDDPNLEDQSLPDLVNHNSETTQIFAKAKRIIAETEDAIVISDGDDEESEPENIKIDINTSPSTLDQC